MHVVWKVRRVLGFLVTSLIIALKSRDELKFLFLTGFCYLMCDDRESLLQYLNIIQARG